MSAAEKAAQAAPRPRVLLVDDDATLRRLVAMMLEELPVEFIGCPSVEAARRVLQAAPVQLLITDWMMPGESGLSLLQWLQAHPAQRAQARLVVFSAGLGDGLLGQIEGLDVWRTLPKPVSVHAMEQCVRDALGWACEREAAPAAESAPDGGEARALRLHFAGNLALFKAFKSDCALQLEADMAAGEAAVAARDAAALRRLAHDLKSVSRSLGHDAVADQAQQLEDACAAQAWPLALQRWPRVAQLYRAAAGG